MINIKPSLDKLTTSLRHAWQRNPVRAVLILAMIPAGAGTVLSLVWPHSREIVYEMHPVFMQCLSTGACVTRIELVIGNTGQALESVRLTWPDYRGKWNRGQQVLNISADRPRNRDPDITCAVAGSRLDCVIEQFAPGALVILHLDCYQCSEQQAQSVADTPLRVQTDARLSSGDPRVTLLFRRLLALVELF